MVYPGADHTRGTEWSHSAVRLVKWNSKSKSVGSILLFIFKQKTEVHGRVPCFLSHVDKHEQ